ncbi:DUF2784 family protein [Nocardioides okcheonensis]|uniref:DUF2784 family protein n=1 Tax=Nocardioides okcheonensis TaxID=2894081 RepID=UPI001E362EDA|nr:DUF2784 family protein [Nocardioides okcheonensis]UFN45136.1 DUF2784 domain-containing protein [Nocardioides okcheonensis]
MKHLRSQGGCPLTVLEKDLIERAGGTPYSGSFLDHYIFGILLPDGTQAFVYATDLVVIFATYAFVVLRLRRRAVRGAGEGAVSVSAEVTQRAVRLREELVAATVAAVVTVAPTAHHG